MRIFTRNRVLAIAILAVLALIIGFLPKLPDDKPDTNSVKPEPAAESQVNFQEKIEARKTQWRNLDPKIPVIVWRVFEDEKGAIGQTTIGLLLTVRPDGYNVDLPTGISVNDGIVFADLWYASRTELMSETKFRDLFQGVKESTLKDRYDRPLTLTKQEISENINSLDREAAQARKKESDKALTFLFGFMGFLIVILIVVAIIISIDESRRKKKILSQK